MSNEVDRLLHDIDRFKERLAIIEAKMQQITLDDANSQIIADFLKSFLERFHYMEAGEKKLLLQSVIKRIDILNKNKINLKLTLPIPPQKKRSEKKDVAPSFAPLSSLATPTGFEPVLQG